ncbi:MAG: hypothetical protein OEZ00_02830 [Dehalococcoidia bacterium]|nr:hypothetical protein [Dehalococcoidia bacterium]
MVIVTLFSPIGSVVSNVALADLPGSCIAVSHPQPEARGYFDERGGGE